MSELWSSQQHEWLTALGHTSYVQGSAEAPAVAAKPALAETTPRPPSAALPAPAGAAPRSRAPQPEAAAPVRAAPAPRRAASRLPDRLHFALIRASGCDPAAEDAAAIIARWPSSAELRGNPAAKRALWPQLRALRRRPQ